MEFRRVGRSGLRVSAISIGGWLTFGTQVDGATTERILDAAFAHGVNFVDLADAYGPEGAAERSVGAAIRSARRSGLVLSSKVFWPTGSGPNDRGLSRKHIVESCEESLRRLRTDYLDIYFCHRADPETPLDETVRAMEDLIRQGKVLYWGTSCWDQFTLARACELAAVRPIVEQPCYNLMRRDIERKLMPMTRRFGLGLTVWSPLAGGALTGKYDDATPSESRGGTSEWLKNYLTEDTRPRLREFSALAQEAGCTPAQLALRWCLRRPEVASVITGATRVSQIEANAAAAELDISNDILHAAGSLFPVAA